jgi:hypothetical protein
VTLELKHSLREDEYVIMVIIMNMLSSKLVLCVLFLVVANFFQSTPNLFFLAGLRFVSTNLAYLST